MFSESLAANGVIALPKGQVELEPGGGVGRCGHMADDKIYTEPSKVTVEGGVVSVKGPDAVDVKMTPEAADETSERLLYGAMQALGGKIPEAASDEEQSEGREAVD